MLNSERVLGLKVVVSGKRLGCGEARQDSWLHRSGVRAASRAMVLSVACAGVLVLQAGAQTVVLVMPATALMNAAGKGSQRGVVRTPGYLGIEFRDLTDDQCPNLRLKAGTRGVVVGMVDHDGPAGKAGLQPNDVIVSMNGQSVPNMDTLRRMIHDNGAGTTVVFAIFRQGGATKIGVQLGDREEVEREALKRMAELADTPLPADGGGNVPDGVGSRFAEPAATRGGESAGAVSHQSLLAAMLHMTPFTGLAMEEMGPQLSAFFGAPGGTGLLVDTVLENSPAMSAGLRAGDVVTKADAVWLKSTSDWTRHLRAVKGKPITLQVIRDKQVMTVTIQADLKRHSMLEWPKIFGAAD